MKIIAIGSSAGALEPLKEIVSRLPKNLDAAIVIIPHLLPDKPSMLGSILGRYTQISINKISSGAKIRSDKIYVLSEGNYAEMNGTRFELIPRNHAIRTNNAIDVYFKSLAPVFGGDVLGVILSGGGVDGVEGAKYIEKFGGKVIVQDPNTAQFTLMPETLIAKDDPDHILSPIKIADYILKFSDLPL